MSTGCASMRSPRCCIATTRAQQGQWIPNVYGGRENLEAIGFLRHFNAVVGERCAGAITLAEEFDGVARRVAADQRGRAGLRLQVEHGLDARHASLHRARSGPPTLAPQRDDVRPAVRVRRELRAAAVARRGRLWKALADRQDAWRQLAALRQSARYFGFMWGHPGKKLLFMGGEIAQEHEWNHDGELDWGALERSAAARRPAPGARPEPASMLASRRCISAMWSPPDSAGWSAMTGRTRFSRSCATATKLPRRCWWSAT